MQDRFTEYFCCPSRYSIFTTQQPLSSNSGFFRLGSEVAFGHCFGANPAKSARQTLPDVPWALDSKNGRVLIPFDINEVVDNLRGEVYATAEPNGSTPGRAIRNLYYGLRPYLNLSFRKYLQQIYLRDWREIQFPHWPVDYSVDALFQQLMRCAIDKTSDKRVPFIWFWPDGASACAVLTHDVETEAGRDYCATVMDLDDSFGLKASFQLVPEVRYHLDQAFLESLRQRDFEICVQDLNHDGLLFRDEEQFRTRVKRINQYAKLWKAVGFRSAVLYRNQAWFDALEFDYDMSVPNVGRLDPQRGGCCTVMPYFIGKLLELPVTATQDYSLFHVLGDYGMELWKTQIQEIMKYHGFINFIIHPDYITKSKEISAVKQLLTHIAYLRSDQKLWTPKPSAAATWWRQRARMSIVEEAGIVKVRGEGSEHARIAYATMDAGRVVYNIAGKAAAQSN